MTPRPVAGVGDVHAALAAPMRRRLLAHLEGARSPLDAHHLAEEVGLHPSTVRFHLETLRSAGLVQRSDPSGPGRSETVGRPRTAYSVTGGPRARPGYEELARRLAAGLGDTPATRSVLAERVGAAWGEELASSVSAEDPASASAVIAHTTRVLDDLGFGPSRVKDDGDGVRIALHGCPFREVAREHPEVCSLHRGLLTASLGARNGPLTAELLPFVEPDLCMVHLDSAG